MCLKTIKLHAKYRLYELLDENFVLQFGKNDYKG